MSQHPQQPPPDDSGIPVRQHSFDGIQEYDQRLPNWWLYTLYGSIVFAVLYWFAYMIAGLMPADGDEVDAAMARVAATKLASSIDVTNDALFWEMSRNPVFVEAGKQVFNSNCVACHLASLRGKTENPVAIGPDLVDTAWVHGGLPRQIYAIAAKGVMAKGMPAWEPVLGQKKTVEVIAFLLSHHQQGEAITVETPK